MNHRSTIDIAVRAKPHSSPLGDKVQRFQIEAVPKEILSEDALYQRFARYYNVDTLTAEHEIRRVEGFILKELSEGNRLDFSLVSIYPHVTGTISTRDEDPAKAGLEVIGAVKARSQLRDAPKNTLIPVNHTSKRAYGYIDGVTAEGIPWTRGRDTITTGVKVWVGGTVCVFSGDDPEEGIWLETWDKKVVARAIDVVANGSGGATCRFEGTVTKGNYTLVVGSRLGKSKEYKLNRFLHKVRVI